MPPATAPRLPPISPPMAAPPSPPMKALRPVGVLQEEVASGRQLASIARMMVTISDRRERVVGVVMSRNELELELVGGFGSSSLVFGLELR